MKYKQILLSFMICIIGGLAAQLQADDTIPADQVHISTPTYVPGAEFEPPLGRYDYSISWQGIPAASASISVEKEDDYYRVISSARTARGIDMIYKLRYRAEGLINADDLRPVKTVIDHQENSRYKTTQMEFKANGEIESVRSQLGKEDTITKFTSDNFTLDPFSAAFLARSLEWSEGKSYQFDTFNGKARYLIQLTALRKDSIEIDDVEREVWIISPKVQNLSTPNSKQKLREAHIYLSADEKREILKITSSVFVGSVTTELEAFHPSTQPIKIASHRDAKQG